MWRSMWRSLMALSVLVLVAALCRGVSAAEFTLDKGDDGVTVLLDGKLFTRYVTKSGAKPILWPVIGPTGQAVTRAYPMREGDPTEREDHHHHRSFWFTHGDVNGVSFWHEQGENGNIVHRRFDRVETAGDHAVIATTNDWVAPDGTRLCEDQRVLTFGTWGDSRWIDFDITITASRDITFGDTKEGTFGVRVAGTMKVDSQPGGHIVNSEGQTDKDAWGKAASWVDYYGPLEGKTVGIAILNHPSSFRYPTHWHVRTYGLFAANPFGLSDFQGSKEVSGDHAMKEGASFRLSYRVLIHPGDTQEGKVAQAFADYAAQKIAAKP